MESAVADGGTVRVDGDDGVGAGRVADPRTLVDARAPGALGVVGEDDGGAAGGEEVAEPVGDVEGERRLGVSRVRGGAGGVALLAVGADVHLLVDFRGMTEIAGVVTGVDDDGPSGEGESRLGRGGGQRGPGRGRARVSGRRGLRALRALPGFPRRRQGLGGPAPGEHGAAARGGEREGEGTAGGVPVVVRHARDFRAFAGRNRVGIGRRLVTGFADRWTRVSEP